MVTKSVGVRILEIHAVRVYSASDQPWAYSLFAECFAEEVGPDPKPTFNRRYSVFKTDRRSNAPASSSL